MVIFSGKDAPAYGQLLRVACPCEVVVLFLSRTRQSTGAKIQAATGANEDDIVLVKVLPLYAIKAAGKFLCSTLEDPDSPGCGGSNELLAQL